MLQHEIAELIDNTNMYEIVYKTNYSIDLNSAEKEVAALLDEWARSIGKSGNDPEHQIAAFLNRVVNDEIYNAPDELLDSMFERGNVGEFDDYKGISTPKNTLVAYEAAKGGNVPRSFLDVSVLTPAWKNRQIESDISYVDLRRNGWKNVALISEYAVAALKNAMFYDIFNAIDAGISSGAANYIAESTAKPTQATMDALALYLAERANPAECNIIALYKYIQSASKLTGFDSDNMRDEVNRNGRLGVYDGVPLTPITSAKKVGSNLMIPDKRMFGVAGIIGNLDMKGEIHTYEDMDNNKEQVHLMFKDFTYGYSFNDNAIENVCKVVMAQ